MGTIPSLKTAYGFTQSLLNVAPTPIIALRAPTTADRAALGTVWVNKTANAAYILTSVVNNLSTWEGVGGGGGAFTQLTVTPGPISLTGTTTINTTGAAATTIGTGGTGAVNIGNATGNTSVTGTLTTTNTLTVTAGGATISGTTSINTATASTTSIGTGGTGAVNIGNSTGNTGVAGNITVVTGDVIISTAARGITLPGPTRIINGAGVPANGLAVNVGDLYVNTTAASAVTRLYIATAASTWTNVTCAA
jgi:hypothetical protein